MDAPAVAVRDAEIAVAWMDERDGSRDVWLATGAKGRFAAEVRLHQAPVGQQGNPALVARGTGFLAAIGDEGTIRIRTPEGTEHVVTASDERGCNFPRVAAAGTAAWVAYQQGDAARARVCVRRLP
jgi:hypothetical protein